MLMTLYVGTLVLMMFHIEPRKRLTAEERRAKKQRFKEQQAAWLATREKEGWS